MRPTVAIARSAAVVTFLFAAAHVWADPMVPSGGATVIVPPPSVDWFARVVSGLALVVAFIAFVWGRYDKHVERQATQAAKDPSVDLDLTGFPGKDSDIELRITNRADVSIAVLSLSCSGGTLIATRFGQITKSANAIDFNGYRIDRGAEELLICKIKPPPGGGSVEFVVRIRVNEAHQRVYETRLKRQLRG